METLLKPSKAIRQVIQWKTSYSHCIILFNYNTFCKYLFTGQERTGLNKNLQKFQQDKGLKSLNHRHATTAEVLATNTSTND